MEKKINEIRIEMDPDTLAKERGHLKPTDTVKLVPKGPSSSIPSSSVSTSSMSVTEDDTIKPEAIIEPQNKSTIKYLSNVKDSKTGEISKPFTIGGKNYQMVRGVLPSKEIIMAVYCHDDIDENGLNIIHPVQHFEENIAKKAMKESDFDYAASEREYHDRKDIEDSKEKPKEVKKPETNSDSINLSEYKYFLVNEKLGKFRKFKRVSEIAKATMNEDEKFMNLKELKKYFESKIFGRPKNTNNIMTKNELMESINLRKVIKTIKITL